MLDVKEERPAAKRPASGVFARPESAHQRIPVLRNHYYGYGTPRVADG